MKTPSRPNNKKTKQNKTKNPSPAVCQFSSEQKVMTSFEKISSNPQEPILMVLLCYTSLFQKHHKRYHFQLHYNQSITIKGYALTK